MSVFPPSPPPHCGPHTHPGEPAVLKGSVYLRDLVPGLPVVPHAVQVLVVHPLGAEAVQGLGRLADDLGHVDGGAAAAAAAAAAGTCVGGGRGDKGRMLNLVVRVRM